MVRIKKLIFIISLIAFILSPYSNIQAAGSTLTDIPDKYRGDQVTISGTSTFTEVVAKVFDPSNVILYVDVIPVNNEGVYSKSFTLASDTAYGTYKVFVGQDKQIAEDTFVVRERSSGSGGGGGGGGASRPSTKEEITVPVEAGGEGTTLTQTPVTRTTESGGIIKDDVVLTEEHAVETVDQLKEKGLDTARIVIPDDKDEVSEIKVNVPIEAIASLNSGKINLEILTENVKISIPSNSLVNFNQELFFRVVPIKTEEQRKEVEDRAKTEKLVQDIAQDKTVKVYGRPMTIETNMESHPVDLLLPLKDALPANQKEREELLENLVIFIEHDDGTKELVKGSIVSYDTDTLGVQFRIEKFSTFTMVYMENWKGYFANLEAQNQQVNQENLHQAYIAGYPDGTFKPSKNISRAEMAALLSRVYEGESLQSGDVSYKDLLNKHWAYSAIQAAKDTGLMKGYPNGTFGPDKSITRAEMAAIVARWLQLEGEGASAAKDIQGHWAQTPIELVDEANIMNGMPDGTFQPNKPLTRAETVAIINRILKRGPLNGVSTPTWDDVKSNHWAYKDIEEASSKHEFLINEDGAEQLIKK